MTADAGPGGLVQGTLHMLILKTLTLEPLHGYGIGVRLEQISDGGFRVNAGSLFPGLRRLERDGLIRGEWRVTENNRRAKYLPPHGAGPGATQARDAAVGSAGDRHRQDPRGHAGRIVMAVLKRFIGGLTGLFRRTRVEQELDEELRGFLEAAVEAKVAAGMTRDDALRAARVELGSIEAVKDRTRDAGWEITVENAWRDVRYGVRTLRKAPAFAAVVVLTLTLGTGANTAIFSAVNAIMLRTLPAERPEELVSLTAIYPTGAEPFSYAAYRTIAAEGTQLVDALAVSTVRRDAVTIDGPPETAELKWVSGNYFTTLGVLTSVGRPLLAADDLQPPGAAVAVISDAFWTRRFGRDPAVVGRQVRLRGTAFAIVGVARRGFAGETPGESVDVWMPLSAQPNAPKWLWTGHSTTWLRVLARRRPGVRPGAGARRAGAGVRARPGRRGGRDRELRVPAQRAREPPRSGGGERRHLTAARQPRDAAARPDGHRRARAPGRMRERRQPDDDQGRCAP